MTAKEYLRQAKRYEILIECKKRQIERMRDSLTSVSSALGGDRVQGTKDPDKIGDGIARLIDLQTEMTAEVCDYVAKHQEIMNTIDSLDDERHIQLLYLRYMEGKDWEQIAEEMCYTVRWVYLVHGEALREISKRLQ